MFERTVMTQLQCLELTSVSTTFHRPDMTLDVYRGRKTIQQQQQQQHFNHVTPTVYNGVTVEKDLVLPTPPQSMPGFSSKCMVYMYSLYSFIQINMSQAPVHGPACSGG